MSDIEVGSVCKGVRGAMGGGLTGAVPVHVYVPASYES